MRSRTARWGLSTAVLVAAGLALTACGPEDANSAASSTTTSPSATSSAQAGGQSTSGSSTGGNSSSGQGSSSTNASGTAKKTGVKCTDQIDYAGDPRSNAEINSIGEDTGTCPAVKGSSGSDGSGVANAGDETTIVGKLDYLAPGKFTVTPDSGGTMQAFYVSDDTEILGAAAICSDDSGSVSMNGDGYGTSRCTADQLTTAAKTGAVTVRVVMNTKSGDVLSVEERYHP